jgi:hypothetical protein
VRRSIAWLLAVLCVGLLPGSAGAASGTAEWTRVDRTYRDSVGSDVTTYATDVYMTGTGEVPPCETYSDPGSKAACNHVTFVRRYDAGGTLVWGRYFNLGRMNSESDAWLRSTYADAIAVDASGVYITGTVTEWEFDIDRCFLVPPRVTFMCASTR